METASERLLKAITRSSGSFPKRLFVLTGAGISTDSGIPDYRGPNGTYTLRRDYKPITYQNFVSSHPVRQRYWSRSYFGYPKLSSAQPNDTHKAITRLVHLVGGRVVTQNVDGLHEKSGISEDKLITMHGILKYVHCLSCGWRGERGQLQEWLRHENQHLFPTKKLNESDMQTLLGVEMKKNVRPDGDVDIQMDVSKFKYMPCPSCPSGIVKPSVVFFGENIPHKTKNQVFEWLDDSDLMLVVGSSLQVYSAFRLVKRAVERKMPVVILSLGPTRADDIPGIVKLDMPCNVLSKCVDILTI